MNEIKQRKELTKVVLYDWDPIITELEKSTLDVSLNAEWKFISFWERTINKSNIKETWSFTPSGADNYILAQPKEIRHILKKKVDQRKKEWKRINIDILENIKAKIQLLFK